MDQSRKRSRLFVVSMVVLVVVVVFTGFLIFDHYRPGREVERRLRALNDPARMKEAMEYFQQRMKHPDAALVADLAQALSASDPWYERWRPSLVKLLPGVVAARLPSPMPGASVRVAAASLLGGTGTNAQPAVAALIEFSRSQDGLEQVVANQALVQLAPVQPAVRPRLRELMLGSKDLFRISLARLLESLQPGDAEARMVLQNGLGDADATVRYQALMAYPDDEAGQKILLPALAARFSGNDTAEAMAAVARLKAIAGGKDEGAARTNAVALLITALGFPQVWVRSDAAQALAGLGPAASAAVPALQAMLKDADAQVQMVAATALLGIDPKTPGVAEVFMKYLNDEDDELRGAARNGLAALKAGRQPGN